MTTPVAGPSGRSRHARWRLAGRTMALLVAAMLFTALALSDAGYRYVAEALAGVQAVTHAHPVAGAFLFAALAMASAMLVFVSSTLLVPFGVAAWGKVVCLLLFWGGWFLGGALAYGVGRTLGRPVVHWLLPPAITDRWEALIPVRRTFLPALVVQLSIPTDMAGYFFGLVRYPAWPYLAALALAELPYAIGIVYLGEALVERNRGMLFAAAALALAAVLWGWRRRLRGPPFGTGG